MKIKVFVLILSLSLFAANARAFDLHPVVAEKNSVFLDLSFASVRFWTGFEMPPFRLSADYLLPLPAPLAVGVFLTLPDPNLKSFGTRLTYHFNLADAEKLDIYFIYNFDIGFVRNGLLLEYGDDAQDLHLYDFRAGLRYMFSGAFCFVIETGYKLKTLEIGLSIKSN
jgi:hypothetical protein